MKRKKIIPIVVAAGLIVAAAVLWTKFWNGGDDGTIRLSGNIELTQVDIAFKLPGKLVERLVDEGDAVTKGMIIARIDAQQIQQQLGRDQAALLSAQTQLPQLLTAIQFQKQTLSGEIELRRAQVQQAEARLEELVAGSRPQEIQQAQAAVAEARTQYERAAADWKRAQTLFKDDDISAADHDQFRARYEATTASLQRAEEALALVKEGPRKEQIAAARAQLAQARAALQVSEAARLDIRRREQEVATRKAEIERARAQLGITRTQVEDTVAVSPIDGVVLVKSADVGEVLAAGTTVLTIGDIARPWLRGYIREQDLGRVKIGSKATITSDSYPDKRYEGKVSFIASEAEFTPKQIQTPEERARLVYRVKIDVDNPRQELKLNMPVDAVIVLEE